MNHVTPHSSSSLRFRKWSRKGYGVFNSIHREVTIGRLNICSDSTLLSYTKSQFIRMKKLSELTSRVLDGELLSYEEALLLAEVADREALYAAANSIREHFWGDRFDLCSIVNARSGRCTEDCKWCAQSRFYKTHSEEYDLIPLPAVLAQATRNEAAGVRKFSLVTSGRTISHAHLDQLCHQYRTVQQQTRLELCASMGLLDLERMQKLYDAGVRNYHCNIETAPSHFSSLCSTHTMEEKIETLGHARRVGMKLCSGGIIGMGETQQQRVEMAFTLQQLHVDSIPLNLLNPIAGTPLEHTPMLTDDEVLTAIAIFRFLNPKAWIRFAGGRTLFLHLQDRAMRAGINGALVGDLLTTVGVSMNDDIAHIKDLGFQC